MKKRIIIIYIILTAIKLFTIQIDTMREEDPTVFIKPAPNITNRLYSFEDRYSYKYEIYKEKYSWYKDKKFLEIFHGELLGCIYNILIYMWWILSFVIVVYMLFGIRNFIKHRKT